MKSEWDRVGGGVSGLCRGVIYKKMNAMIYMALGP
jgi:hypothetical protein